MTHPPPALVVLALSGLAMAAGPRGAQPLADARTARQGGQYAAAAEHFSRAVADERLSGPDRAIARLEWGDMAWETGDVPGAAGHYGRLLDQQDLAPHLRTLAHLRLALGATRRGDVEEAKAQYQRLAQVPGAPRHHVWEAQYRLGELAGHAPVRAAPPPVGQRAVIHVRPGGGGGDGSAARPLGSFEAARDAIRAMRRKGALPAGGVAVEFAGGDYVVREAMRLTAGDSGTAEAPVVYRAAAGQAVRFVGGTVVKGFGPVRDEAVRQRLPEEARDKVVCADLRAAGITDLGTYNPGGFASGGGFNTRPILEAFLNGRPLQVARYPNEGYLRIAEVTSAAATQSHGIRGSRKGQFHYSGDRPGRWTDEPDLRLYGYFFWDWADSYEAVAGIDPAARLFTLREPVHRYGFRKGQRYYAINALCEIDRPGEWYLDRRAHAGGVLYLYPPGDIAGATVEVSMLEATMLAMRDVQHVALQGLAFDLGRADAVHIQGGARCLIADCTIRRFAGTGITIAGGRGHVILGCEIQSLGRGGLRVDGGDRATLAAGGHVVENCHVHDISRIDHTYTPAVLLDGVGHRVAHNLFHHGNSSALRVEGNDHLVELNEVHTVLLESDDQGGADMWGNPTYRGNIFRWNYWHHIGNGLGCGQAGIRLDDAICGTVVYGNLFYRCSDGGFGGAQIHGGKDNWIDNNVFIACKSAVSFSPWGAGRWRGWIDGAAGQLKAVRHDQPPYAHRYPELATLREGADINHLWSNVALRCDRLFARMPAHPAGQSPAGNALLHAPGFVLTDPLDLRRLRATLDTLPLRPIPLERIGRYSHAGR